MTKPPKSKAEPEKTPDEALQEFLDYLATENPYGDLVVAPEEKELLDAFDPVAESAAIAEGNW